MRPTKRPKTRLRRLAALIVACTLPGLAAAQSADIEQRLMELQEQLEELRASSAGPDEIDMKLDQLEAQLAALQAEVRAGEDEPDAVADESDTEKSAIAELPESGLQGSPNPLQDDNKYLTGKDLLDDDFPNSVPIPGTATRFSVGGYAKLDFIQDLDYVGDRFEFELASIPVAGTPEAELDGRTTLHAKETRLNFDFRGVARNEELGWRFPLQAFVELDFFDDRESFALQPRLRHAYGVVGRILAGQTWNISGDLEAIPGTIDFSGGDALYGDRVAQIRWQDSIGRNLTYAVGIEDPKVSIGNPLGLGGEDRASLPSIAGKLRWGFGNGSHVAVGLDLSPLDWQGGATGPSDTDIGVGVNLTGRWIVNDQSKNAIIAGGSIGDGSAHRVVSLRFDGGANAVITPGGLDLMSHAQAYIGYSHYWTPNLNSTFSTAWAELDNSVFQPGDAIHRTQSVHANLIWFPYKLVSTGFEVMWGERVNNDGAKGEAWRLQYMVKYKFN